MREHNFSQINGSEIAFKISRDLLENSTCVFVRHLLSLS